jgi:hypothetical protein
MDSLQFISAMIRLNQILSRTYEILIAAGDQLAIPPDTPRPTWRRRSISSGSEDSAFNRPPKRKRNKPPTSDMAEDIYGNPRRNIGAQNEKQYDLDKNSNRDVGAQDGKESDMNAARPESPKDGQLPERPLKLDRLMPFHLSAPDPGTGEISSPPKMTVAPPHSDPSQNHPSSPPKLWSTITAPPTSDAPTSDLDDSTKIAHAIPLLNRRVCTPDPLALEPAGPSNDNAPTRYDRWLNKYLALDALRERELEMERWNE